MKLMFNVFSLNDEFELYPLRTSNDSFEFCVNLLLISNENTNHYGLFKSLSPFMKNSQKLKWNCVDTVCKYSLLKKN